MDTRLYVPPAAPIPKKPEEKPSLTFTAADTLRNVRQQTCYKTLRGLIDLLQAGLIVSAALTLVAGAIGMFFAEEPPGLRVLTLIIAICICFVMVVLSIAVKQAALLLVDIADCQIQQVGRTEAISMARVP